MSITNSAPRSGFISICVVAFGFIYYSVWLLITPFIDKDKRWFLQFFPPREYAIIFMAVIGLTMLLGLTSILGCLMIKRSMVMKKRTS
ncbi:hypothetical protein C9374_009591 [Naegleria lovaniensis]|uniref:Dolichol phosphate-mannose biosynthesis regulatory protein n=1 Tax=Naegleria lovaniensis TaxID=51637 RepID=A0AA88GYP7_NAELO|nr:uncharacterized protein C9374_009591 [Naegleria lovaniensis]KAG2393014.1 hypothetical protein C9374_009591 [Naegleria lovaniensis]